MAAQPTNPLDYSGPSAPPIAASAGGTISFGGAVYAVGNITSVAITRVWEPIGYRGYFIAVGSLVSLGALLMAATITVLNLGPAQSEKSWGPAMVCGAVAVLFCPLLFLVRGLFRPRPAVVITTTAGEQSMVACPDIAYATRIRDQISATIDAARSNTYVDNRQVHVHKHS